MIYAIALLITAVLFGTVAHSKWKQSVVAKTKKDYPGRGWPYTPAEDGLILSKSKSDDYLAWLLNRSKGAIHARRYSLKSSAPGTLITTK